MSLATKKLFEREANQGAAELLFQRKHFTRDANDLEIGVEAIWLLSERYGSSFHAALRRYAECHDAAVAAVVFNPTPVADTPRTWKREEAMASRAWQDRFGPEQWPVRMDPVSHPFVAALDFPLGEITIPDRAGSRVTVRVEAQSNTYKRFALLWIPRSRRLLKPLKVRAVEG